jgi:hypothetical protein
MDYYNLDYLTIDPIVLYKNVPKKFLYYAITLAYTTLVFMLLTFLGLYLEHKDIEIFYVIITNCICIFIHLVLDIYICVIVYKHKRCHDEIISSFSEVRKYLYTIKHTRIVFMLYGVLVYDILLLPYFIMEAVKNEIEKGIIYFIIPYGIVVLLIPCITSLPNGNDYIQKIDDKWYKEDENLSLVEVKDY